MPLPRVFNARNHDVQVQSIGMSNLGVDGFIQGFIVLCRRRLEQIILILR